MTDYSTFTDLELNAEIARRLGFTVRGHTLYAPDGTPSYTALEIELDHYALSPLALEQHLLGYRARQYAANDANAALALWNGIEGFSLKPKWNAEYMTIGSEPYDLVFAHHAHAARAIAECWLMYQDALQNSAHAENP